MKKYLIGAAAAASLTTPAMAAEVVIDPNTGGSGTFSWSNGLGQIDDIDGVSDTDNMFFSVTANAGDTISASLDDCCIAGDEFSLFLNGMMVAPSSVATPGGSFEYQFDDIVLAAGVNLFTINLTALAPGFTTGGAFYDFSAVASGVPEPTTWAMMLLGFFAIGGALRARRETKVSVSYS